MRGAELGFWAAGRWREGGCAPCFRHFGGLKVRKTWSNQGGRTGLLGCREVEGRGLCWRLCSAFSALWRAESAAGEVVGRGLCSAFSALWRAESAENME